MADLRTPRDVACFTKADNETLDSVCEVKLSEFSQNYDLLICHIEANRFVRDMVRRLVTVILVGKEKRSFDEFAGMLQEPDKGKNVHGAAAKGLIPEKVKY